MKDKTGDFREAVKQLTAAMNLSAISGGDLAGTVDTLDKLYEHFGKTITGVEPKLLKIGQLADASFSELADLLPQALPAAAAAGLKFEDVGAILAASTRIAGTGRQARQGTIAMIHGLASGRATGAIGPGGLEAQLGAIRSMPRESMQKLFGSGTDLAYALANRGPEVAAASEQIRNAPPSLVSDTMGKIMSDPKSRDAAIQKGLSNRLANRSYESALDATLRNKSIRLDLMKLGWETSTDPFTKDIQPEWARALNFWMKDTIDPDRWNPNLQAGLAVQIDKLQDASAAGDLSAGMQANLLKVQFGEGTGTYYMRNGEKVYTGEAEAQEYAKALRMGYTGLTAGEFTEAKRLFYGSGAAAANDYVRRVGKPEATTSGPGGGDLSVISGHLRAAADGIDALGDAPDVPPSTGDGFGLQ